MWHADFSYYGPNVYAYVLAKYGQWIDFCSIQLYESYSRAAYAITQQGETPDAYLTRFVREHVERKETFGVQFQDDPSTGIRNQLVSLPLSKFVIGLANGWATTDKAIFISPADVAKAVVQLRIAGMEPRGFMFWTINEEGTNGINMAKGLHHALNETVTMRPQTQASAL